MIYSQLLSKLCCACSAGLTVEGHFHMIIYYTSFCHGSIVTVMDVSGFYYFFKIVSCRLTFFGEYHVHSLIPVFLYVGGTVNDC